MIGETRHRNQYPTLFEEWQGVFYVQCPIDGAPHTMAFDNPVMVHWGKRPVNCQGTTNIMGPFHEAIDFNRKIYRIVEICRRESGDMLLPN